jgi:hypothetical protein
MKGRIFNILVLAAVILVGCKKKDGVYPYSVDLKRVPYVNVNVDPSGSQAIDVLNLASFQGKYNVSLFYPDDVKPSKVDVVAIKNGNKGNVKVLQTGVSTFPSTFTITAAQLATLFGSAVALGDNYDIGVDIYAADGTKYEAFPNYTGSTAYGGTGQANQPGFSPVSRFSAICAYDSTIFQGNFQVVSDGFGDFSPGEIVPITKIDNTHFSFIDPYVTNPVPIIVAVNVLNNSLSITKQKIGDKFVWNLAYTNPNMAASGSGNFAAPCDKTINLNIAYTIDQGSFGSYPLILKKP